MAKTAAQNPPPTESAPQAKTVSPSDLNGEVQIPTSNPRAIEALQNPELPGIAQDPAAASPPPTPSISGDTDSAGEKWDPAKHSKKKTKNAAGRWHAKNGRRPNTAGASAPAQDPAQVSVVGDSPGQQFLPGFAPAVDRFDAAAELYTQTGYAILGALFKAPDEWRPDSDGEHASLKSAVAAYLRHKQTEDLPPGMALALGLGSFVVPRLMRPKTRQSIKSGVEMLRGLRGKSDAKTEFASPVAQAPAPVQLPPSVPGSVPPQDPASPVTFQPPEDSHE
jgi:hypothetical protein